MTDLARIRNFSIVAHIDHGKSTLADRLIQATGTVEDRDMKEQMLDSMDIERERGITIKAQTVRLEYKAKDGETYILNLIDTPGHVDFAYEVSRSMRAVEGSLLVVDASQGVEAQTLANVYQAIDADHEIVPVLNKIDLPAAEPERVKEQIEDVIGIDASEAVMISAKTGIGIPDVLEAIVTRLPAPEGVRDAPLKAMLVDSWYDAYLGVVVLVRIKEGVLKKGDRIRMMSTKAMYPVDRVGVFRPGMLPVDELGPGEIGFLTASIKQVRDTRVGDTITHEKKPAATPLPGFKPSIPVVFCGLFPVDNADFEDLRDAIEKLALNDASFTHEMETSAALGFGFRCGFLGLLHLEVIRDRLEREYDIDLITTAPSVIYQIYLTDGAVKELHNPADMPDPAKIDHIEEPRIKATILVPDDYLGDVLKLCQDRRGIQLDLTYAGARAMVVYDLPLNEVVFDFYDRLKSVTKGYASFDYQMEGYREDNLVKMQILVNDEPVDALSTMVHRDRAEGRGRAMCEKLKELIPQHMFKVPIQAAIGGRIIARETISALRKDVTAKCYGGDVTRKRKLLEKQKAGKKKMRQFGKVDIPQEAFINALKMDGQGRQALNLVDSLQVIVGFIAIGALLDRMVVSTATERFQFSKENVEFGRLLKNFFDGVFVRFFGTDPFAARYILRVVLMYSAVFASICSAYSISIFGIEGYVVILSNIPSIFILLVFFGFSFICWISLFQTQLFMFEAIDSRTGIARFVFIGCDLLASSNIFIFLFTGVLSFSMYIYNYSTIVPAVNGAVNQIGIKVEKQKLGYSRYFPDEEAYRYMIRYHALVDGAEVDFSNSFFDIQSTKPVLLPESFMDASEVVWIESFENESWPRTSYNSAENRDEDAVSKIESAERISYYFTFTVNNIDPLDRIQLYSNTFLAVDQIEDGFLGIANGDHLYISATSLFRLIRGFNPYFEERLCVDRYLERIDSVSIRVEQGHCDDEIFVVSGRRVLGSNYAYSSVVEFDDFSLPLTPFYFSAMSISLIFYFVVIAYFLLFYTAYIATRFEVSTKALSIAPFSFSGLIIGILVVTILMLQS